MLGYAQVRTSVKLVAWSKLNDTRIDKQKVMYVNAVLSCDAVRSLIGFGTVPKEVTS